MHTLIHLHLPPISSPCSTTNTVGKCGLSVGLLWTHCGSIRLKFRCGHSAVGSHKRQKTVNGKQRTVGSKQSLFLLFVIADLLFRIKIQRQKYKIQISNVLSLRVILERLSARGLYREVISSKQSQWAVGGLEFSVCNVLRS